MSLRVSTKRFQLSKRLVTFVAIFALLVQPTYVLVASQVANAMTATVTTQQELKDAVADTGVSTIAIGGAITTTEEIVIGRSLTLQGGTLQAGFNENGVNNSVVEVTGTANTVTFDGVTLVGNTNLHGINAYVTNIVLNNTTISNNGRTAINVNGSVVTINSLATTGNGRTFLGFTSHGVIDLAKGGGVTRTPTLIVNGPVTHAENLTHVRYAVSDRSTSGIQIGQYYDVTGGLRLKSAPLAPSITSPAGGSTQTTKDVAVAWSAPAASASRQDVSYYVVTFGADGQPGSTRNIPASSPLETLYENLTDGSYTVSIQSFAASGLAGGTATQTFTVAVPVPEAPTNLKVKVTPTGSDVAHLGYTNRNQLTASWDAPAGGADSYIYTYWNDVATSPYTAASPWTNSTTATSYPGTVNQGEGVHHWSVRAVKDGVPSELATTYTYMYETTPPTATIATPVSSVNTTVPFTISGTYDDTHAPTQSGVGRLHLYVSANGNTLAQPFIVPASQLNQVSGLYSYTLTSADVARLSSELNLQSGQQFTVTAWVYDRANNWTNTTKKTFTADNTNPTININSYQGNLALNVFREVSFGYYDANKAAYAMFNEGEPHSKTHNFGDAVWSNTDTVWANRGWTGVTEGQNTVTLYDVAGNSMTRTFILDRTAPTVTITSPTIASVHSGSVVVSGKATDANGILNDEVTVSFRGPLGSTSASCGSAGAFFGTVTVPVDADGNWTTTVDISGFENGYYCITAQASDNAGNVVAQSGTHLKYFTVNNVTEEPEVEPSEVWILDHAPNDDGTYTIIGKTTHPTDRVQLWFLTDEGDVEIEGVVVDADGNWSATTSEALVPGEYVLFAVTTNEQGTETPVEGLYEFTVASQNNNNGGGQQGGAEVPVPEDDDEDESADQDGFIAFLPATFGGLGLNDGAATTPLPATPTTETDDDTDILGAQDTRTSWSVVNAALAGFIAILAVVALAGIRRKESDNNTGARVFMLVPAVAAVVAFFLVEDIGGSMAWFNIWTWLFAGILVVQAILATLTTKTAND